MNLDKIVRKIGTGKVAPSTTWRSGDTAAHKRWLPPGKDDWRVWENSRREIKMVKLK